VLAFLVSGLTALLAMVCVWLGWEKPEAESSRAV